MIKNLKLKFINNKIYPRIIICGGGTGGHIYTGIAIADEIKYQIPYSKILFIGSKNHMEMKEVPKYGYSIKKISISGGRNKIFSISGLFLFIELIESFFLVKKIIKNFSPNIIIGTGGFVSFPTLLAAKSNKIPILIQEQNSFPGITNRIFSRYADKICIAYKQSQKFFPKGKTIITGNPIRTKILKKFPSKKQACKYFGLNMKKPIILSLGGSTGSKLINNAWKNGISKLINLDIQLIWQIGSYIDNIKNNIKIYNYPNIIIIKFIKDIQMCYAASDIIISRAGALTISEICYLKKPNILIPFSRSSDNHQCKNAYILKKHKASIVIQDEEIEKELVDLSIKLISDIPLQKQMVKNISNLGKPNASKDIVNEILQIIK